MIACGGTGGHIYPAIAVAEAFLDAPERDGSDQVLFCGAAQGVESRLVPQSGFAFEGIPVAGLRGKSPRALARGLGLLPRALAASWSRLRTFRPHVVLGTGGFASGPLLLTAAARRVPTVIQEQNRRFGFTNKLLARMVREVCVSFPETAEELGRGVVTGNPVREAFFHLPPPRPSSDRMRVLVFGGSQGSRTLNRALSGALPELKELGDRLVLTHQTGPREHEEVAEAYRRARSPSHWSPVAYIDPMSEAFGRADLVLCRAGATTVAELCAAGRGSVLVPFPHATGDHQTENARALVERGAAVLVPDEEFDSGRVVGLLRAFLERPDDLRRMGEAARKLARPEAAREIAALLRRQGSPERPGEEAA